MVTFKATNIHQPRWAALVRSERKRLGLTQSQFGHLFGASHTSISNWEKGKADPNANFCWWYFKKLERRIEELKK